VIAGFARGQVPGSDSTQTVRHARVTIQTNVESALVIMDSLRVGVTPLTIDSLASGKHIITLQHPDLANWLAGSITDTIQVIGNEPRTLRYAFPLRSFIISNPFGAAVYVGDSLYGTTPLLVTQSWPSGQSTINLRKEGFEPITVDLADARRGILSLTLPHHWQKEGIAGPLLNDEGSESSRNLRLYVSGASTVISGVAAAYLKVKADDRYLQYAATGDPSLLSQTHRLDTAAGVALAVTQIALGFFTYFILSE